MAEDNNNQNQTPPTAQAQTAPQIDIDYDKLASVIDGRQRAAGESAMKNYLRQQGLTEDQMQTAIANYKAAEEAKKPNFAAMQKQIDDANNLVIHAEIKGLGVAMGLVDADAAVKLMDMSKVKFENGKVSGAQEALDALKQDKPYLFGTSAKPRATGMSHQGGKEVDRSKKDEANEALRSLFQ